MSPDAISPAAVTVPSNTVDESFVLETSASSCLESMQPLPLGDQNLNLNLDADDAKSPVSAINNFFNNHFVPDRSNRHLDAIEPLSLPQDGAFRQPLDATDAMTLKLLDKMRASILAGHGLSRFETSGRNTGMARFQGFSDTRHQLLVNNRNQQVHNLGRMNQQHNWHKSQGYNTSNNELAPIDSLTNTTSLSSADKSLLLDMLQTRE